MQILPKVDMQTRYCEVLCVPKIGSREMHLIGARHPISRVTYCVYLASMGAITPVTLPPYLGVHAQPDLYSIVRIW